MRFFYFIVYRKTSARENGMFLPEERMLMAAIIPHISRNINNIKNKTFIIKNFIPLPFLTKNCIIYNKFITIEQRKCKEKG